MDKLEALDVIRAAVVGICRLASKNSAMLGDLTQRHRDMGGIPRVRKVIQSALPAIRELRDACNSAISELEKWPIERDE